MMLDAGEIHMRENVVLRGVIVGETVKVECLIRALKVTLEGSPVPPEHTDYSVVESPVTNRLPDGNYTIHASGKTMQVRRKNGTFLAAF